MVINHNFYAIHAYRVLRFRQRAIDKIKMALYPEIRIRRAGDSISALTFPEKITAKIQKFFHACESLIMSGIIEEISVEPVTKTNQEPVYILAEMLVETS